MSSVRVTVCLPSASGLSALASALTTESDFLAWADTSWVLQANSATSATASAPTTGRELVRAIADSSVTREMPPGGNRFLIASGYCTPARNDEPCEVCGGLLIGVRQAVPSSREGSATTVC